MLQRNEQGICRFIEMTVISINRLTVSNSCKPYFFYVIFCTSGRSGVP